MTVKEVEEVKELFPWLLPAFEETVSVKKTKVA